MDLFTNGNNQTLLPGQRLLKTKGYEAAEKYPMPRDCEVVIFDDGDQTQTILGNLGRFVAWAGSGSPTTTATVAG